MEALLNQITLMLHTKLGTESSWFCLKVHAFSITLNCYSENHPIVFANSFLSRNGSPEIRVVEIHSSDLNLSPQNLE